ncbi:hypothetical protein IRJ41_012087 [Triplophysa rosa]|uniref:Uncharacterized protein n=1 Tax=Triplophysa rosa TaxID=992332 RepID=A0A9W8C1A7_TRIRA|nr:hypothetical protein IRJ41_012087 [Triplophysa rosa]
MHASSVNTTISRDFLAPRTTSRSVYGAVRAKRETHRVRSRRRRAWFSVYPVHPCSIRAFKEDAQGRRGKPIGLPTSARLSHCRGVGRSRERERETAPRRERERTREESNGRRGKPLHNAFESGAREAASEQERRRERELVCRSNEFSGNMNDVTIVKEGWVQKRVCVRGSRRVGVPQCMRVHEVCMSLLLEKIRVGSCVFGGLSE